MYAYFGDNLSGLYFEPPAENKPAVLWAVENYPSMLYRLVWNGTLWLPEQAQNWDQGKQTYYVDGTGSPDSEDITKGGMFSNMIYICSERDSHSDISKNMIIMYT